MASGRLRRAFYARSSALVAPELLHKLVAVEGPTGRRSGRVVEVEAYAGAADPASHAYRGPTRRNSVMFGPPGHLYVYFTYGLHWCANVVCGPPGTAEAVLLRALIPTEGLEAMRLARRSPAGRVPADRDLCRGPARLAQALGLTGADDGVDVCVPGRLALIDDGTAAPPSPGVGPRVGLGIGLGAAAEVPWRWWVPEDPHVSPYRSGARRRR